DNAIKYAVPKLLAPALAPGTAPVLPAGTAAPPGPGTAPALGSGPDEAISEAVPGRPPWTILVSARGEGGRALLAIPDSGPGIPAREGDRGVERFVRLEQSRSEPGAGLGLSLAAAVARLHHGELRLEDNAPGLKAVLVLRQA